MDINDEEIDILVNRLQKINADIQLLIHLNIVYSKHWHAMFSVNEKMAQLKIEKNYIIKMLEHEFEKNMSQPAPTLSASENKYPKDKL